MPFRRQRLNVPVNTLKHETTWTFLAQNASTAQTVVLIQATESPVTGNEVDIGSVVKSIFFESNLNGVDNSSGAQVFHWYIMKQPAGLATPAPNVYQSDQKKYILKRGMEMLPDIPLDSGGTVQTKRIFALKIPPRLRRFDDGDALILRYISTSASGINYCGISIYKEWK